MVILHRIPIVGVKPCGARLLTRILGFTECGKLRCRVHSFFLWTVADIESNMAGAARQQRSKNRADGPSLRVPDRSAAEERSRSLSLAVERTSSRCTDVFRRRSRSACTDSSDLLPGLVQIDPDRSGPARERPPAHDAKSPETP